MSPACETKVNTPWLKQQTCFFKAPCNSQSLQKARVLDGKQLSLCSRPHFMWQENVTQNTRPSLIPRLSPRAYSKQQKAGQGLEGRLHQTLFLPFGRGEENENFYTACFPLYHWLKSLRCKDSITCTCKLYQLNCALYHLRLPSSILLDLIF